MLNRVSVYSVWLRCDNCNSEEMHYRIPVATTIGEFVLDAKCQYCQRTRLDPYSAKSAGELGEDKDG